uniref:Uncharacterized protein n=1 Tax=Brassica campestris TaxID=3711 RepID=A0A3P5YSF5_BRACM|nr:unnamed protein product [Brassica rapa]
MMLMIRSAKALRSVRPPFMETAGTLRISLFHRTHTSSCLSSAKEPSLVVAIERCLLLTKRD